MISSFSEFVYVWIDLGEASLPESKAWEIAARVRHLSSLHVLSYIQVSQLMGSFNWASGLIPLGRLYLRPLQRHFHSLGLTVRFTPPRRSDPLVLANLLRRWQDPRFLTSGIPLRTFQAKFTIFTDASTQGWGAHMGDSQISGTWTHADGKLHINCLELKAIFHALTFYSTQPNRPRASPAISKHVGQVPYSRGFKFGEKGPIKILAHFCLQVRRC